MNKILLTPLALLLFVGCSHVTQADLQASQADLKRDLQAELNQQDAATLECVQAATTAQQAFMICHAHGTHCSVVEAFKEHCMREDSETGQTLPAKPGVENKIERLIEEENERVENAS